MHIATAESIESWTGFFRDLKARGLIGVYLVTSDAHLGIQHAVGDVFPKSCLAAVPGAFREESFVYGAEEAMGGGIGDVPDDFRAGHSRKRSGLRPDGLLITLVMGFPRWLCI